MTQFLGIDGSEQLIDIYGEWPSFHDAEILLICLDRNYYDEINHSYRPAITIKIHCFNLTNDIIEGKYKTTKHHSITLIFTGLVEFEFKYGFGNQNVVSDIIITDISSHQLEDIKYSIYIDSMTQCELQFQCHKTKVLSIEAGIPMCSIYR